MANETISPSGPLFGPNRVIITVDDEEDRTFQLNVFPDANNPLLKRNGLAMHYYFMPQRVYLARKQESPEDYDFGVSVFKGLMNTETTIGITDANTTAGEAGIGGGICSFSTTFAIPNKVIQKAKKKLIGNDYQKKGALVNKLFNKFTASDREPVLGIVPMLENNVTIEIPALVKVGTEKLPFFIDAQGAGKGSIEAQGINSYLITMNQLAAGAVVGSIEEGISPFTVHYNLKQQFYINACDIHIIVDVDKVFKQFSASVDAGFALGSASFSHNYQKCITSGAIKTIIKMNNAELPEDLRKMIEEKVEDMQVFAFDLVKKEIFDWTPTPEAPASSKRGIWGRIFGGADVSLKSNYQKKSVKLTNDFRLDSSIAVYHTVSGDLGDLEPAIQANKDKYLAIVAIDKYFKKLQIAATNNANWDEKLNDGTDLSDPVKALQIEVGYPDYSNPLNASNEPNPQYRTQGFHYTVGKKDNTSGAELAVWSDTNPNDIINISFLKLDNNIPNWDVDQVKIRKTIVFNSADPRVELSSGGSTFVKEEVIKSHAPVITPDEVGYVFVKFMITQPLPTDNIIVTITCKIGNRKDTLTVTNANQKNILWEIYSDKYLDQTSFQYQVQVDVSGPNFTDAPVQYQSDMITASLPTGRVKYINPLKVVLPVAPEDKVDVINDYIKRSQPEPEPEG